MPFKKCMFLVAVLMATLIVQGCETLKGAGTGFKKDTEHLGTNIQSLDQWMGEHLW